MKNYKCLVFLLMVSFFLLSSCVSSSKESDVIAVHDIQDNELYTVDVELPVFEGQDNLNSLIAEQVDSWFNGFKQEIEQVSANMANKKDLKGAFYIDWQLKQNSNEIISVLLSAYTYTGGANGQDQLASFLWNKKEQSMIPLEQVLPSVVNPPNLERLAEQCRTQLIEILEASKDSFLEEMIKEGTLPVKDNFQVFTMSKPGITFYFTKYQVAPGSYGIQEVFLPFLK